MIDMAAIIVIAVVALALWWKIRCIWRGCTIDPEARDRD